VKQEGPRPRARPRPASPRRRGRIPNPERGRPQDRCPRLARFRAAWLRRVRPPPGGHVLTFDPGSRTERQGSNVARRRRRNVIEVTPPEVTTAPRPSPDDSATRRGPEHPYPKAADLRGRCRGPSRRSSFRSSLLQEGGATRTTRPGRDEPRTTTPDTSYNPSSDHAPGGLQPSGPARTYYGLVRPSPATLRGRDRRSRRPTGFSGSSKRRPRSPVTRRRRTRAARPSSARPLAVLATLLVPKHDVPDADGRSPRARADCGGPARAALPVHRASGSSSPRGPATPVVARRWQRTSAWATAKPTPRSRRCPPSFVRPITPLPRRSRVASRDGPAIPTSHAGGQSPATCSISFLARVATRFGRGSGT